MSIRTTFKRISLAVVAAMGLGVLTSGPSTAVITGPTLTIASATASVTAGETATAVLTASFTSFGGVTTDTMAVTAIRTTGSTDGGSTPGWRAPAAADSSNASVLKVYSNTIEALAVQDKLMTATLRYDLVGFTTAGTYTYTFYPSFKSAGAAPTAPAAVTFTVTVAAKNVTPSATYSKASIVGGSGSVTNADSATIVGYGPSFTADSSVVVDKGTSASPVIVAKITPRLRNSSDTNIVTGTLVNESVTASITGPGYLSLLDGATRLRAVTTVLGSDTILVWSDGTAGTATITLTTATLTTWTAKTLTFTGDMTVATATLSDTHISTASADSAVVRVTPKDSASNLVTKASTVYLYSSDTRVVNTSDTATACSVSATSALGYGTCALPIIDSGSVTITVRDSSTVAGSTWSAVAGVLNITGDPAKVTMKLDKTSYSPGEKATVTLTVTDGLGRGVSGRTIVSLFDAGGITSTATLGSGSDTISGETVTVTDTAGFGTKTYTIYMPSQGQRVVLSAGVGTAFLTDSALTVSDTVTVVDPAEESANAALDAAQEATDAAIAATDAAVLAQESADAAAVAAEAAAETAAEAADAAKAAVDAVTKLSAEVTKLLTQFATLQKLMTRIAKKVGVKV